MLEAAHELGFKMPTHPHVVCALARSLECEGDDGARHPAGALFSITDIHADHACLLALLEEPDAVDRATQPYLDLGEDLLGDLDRSLAFFLEAFDLARRQQVLPSKIREFHEQSFLVLHRDQYLCFLYEFLK